MLWHWLCRANSRDNIWTEITRPKTDPLMMSDNTADVTLSLPVVKRLRGISQTRIG